MYELEKAAPCPPGLPPKLSAFHLHQVTKACQGVQALTDPLDDAHSPDKRTFVPASCHKISSATKFDPSRTISQLGEPRHLFVHIQLFRRRNSTPARRFPRLRRYAIAGRREPQDARVSGEGAEWTAPDH
jgi:hypothetical protein